MNFVYDRTKDCHISDFGATSFASFLPFLTMKLVGERGGADKNIFTRKDSDILQKLKCHLWFLIFLLQSTFFFRNGDVKTYLQERVGKGKDILVAT